MDDVGDYSEASSGDDSIYLNAADLDAEPRFSSNESESDDNDSKNCNPIWQSHNATYHLHKS